MGNRLKISGVFYISAKDLDGNYVIWRKRAGNLVPNAALNYLRNVAIMDGADKITSFYIMPLATGASVDPDGGDEYDNHPGFIEFTNYDETTRPIFNDHAMGDGVVTNEGFEAIITMGAGSASARTIAGVALVGGGAAPEEKGGANTMLLFSAAELDDGEIEFPEGYEVEIMYELTFARG